MQYTIILVLLCLSVVQLSIIQFPPCKSQQNVPDISDFDHLTSSDGLHAVTV